MAVATPRDVTEISPVAALQGEVRIPGDKSITHRAILLNALATGEARIRQSGLGDDCRATIDCLNSLGADIETISDTDLVIRGSGPQGFGEPSDVLDCGNSGTTMRFLIGLLAGLGVYSVISGDSSLRERPMGRVVHPLRLMGARISGRDDGEHAPLSILGGALCGIEYEMPVASAQVKSALLIAGSLASGTTTFRQPAPSRDHTELMLRSQGVEIREDGLTLSIAGPQTATAVDVVVPGNISSAAFWLVAGAIHPSADLLLRGVGVNPSRSGVLDVLRRMGAHIDVRMSGSGAEPTADLRARSSSLRGTRIEGDEIPNVQDEIPLIVLAATQARGVTEIRGAGELRVKETDRIAATRQELTRLGALIEELPDGLIIEGPTPLKAADVDSHGDHRMAMCLGVAGLIAEGTTVVHDASCAAVSDPWFWSEIARLSKQNA